MMKLLLEALVKFFCGVLAVGALVFLPAGTLDYPNGWMLFCVMFLPMFVFGFVLLFLSPDLLKKRLDIKEKEKEQKHVILLSAIMFILGFVVAGLDFRVGFSRVPTSVTLVASGVFLFLYLLYAEVMRENAYLSRTIKVEEGQKVIDTGLYGIVRHPMYMVTVFLFLMIPLILGSFISFVIFLVYPLVIILRIKNEEKVLCENLLGYKEYMKKVKYRLVPFIW